MEVQAVTSDEIFQQWLENAGGKTLKKYFEKKNVDFRREHVSAVETVYNVSKFMVIYYQKKVPDAHADKESGKVETVTADKLERYRFYDFKGQRVDFDKWKGDTNVPSYTSIRRVDCQKCQGSGTYRCEKCNGSAKIKCDKCDGTGKNTCSACKGRNVLSIELDVFDADNKKTKVQRNIPCPRCGHTGEDVCSKCGGGGFVLCRNCDGGTTTCKECKGHGVFYQFKYEPVPFITQRKSAMVFYKKDVEKFIDKRDVEQLLNSRETSGISLYNVDDLNQSKLVPLLNYWTPDADKVCNNARKEFKKLLVTMQEKNSKNCSKIEK
ncbi:MAG: hypothetical protein ACTSP7_06660 [Candidatus Heimdallarchaeota archaeon]